jgi:hypothetical protein
MSYTINDAVAEYTKIIEDRTSKKIDDPGVRERVNALNSKCAEEGVIFSADADVIIAGVKGEPLPTEEEDYGSYGDDSSWEDDWESYSF